MSVFCFPFYFYLSLSFCCFSIFYFFAERFFISSSIGLTCYPPYICCSAFSNLKAFNVLAVLLKAVTFLTASLNLFFNGLINAGGRRGESKNYFYYFDLKKLKIVDYLFYTISEYFPYSSIIPFEMIAILSSGCTADIYPIVIMINTFYYCFFRKSFYTIISYLCYSPSTGRSRV